MYRAIVVDVTEDPGRAYVMVPKLYGDSVIKMQSSIEVSPGDRVLVDDCSPKAHTRDWIIFQHESKIGRWYTPGPHEHSQGDVAGLVDRLAALEARVAALEGTP